MTKPEDIPQDVWDAAEDAFDTLLCNDIQASGTSEQFRIDSITPVARAILAERERRSADDAQLIARIERLLAAENLLFAECSLAEEWALVMRDALAALRKGGV